MGKGLAMLGLRFGKGFGVGNFVVWGKFLCFFGRPGVGDISWVGNSFGVGTRDGVGNSCFGFWFGKGWLVCSSGGVWVFFFLNFLLVVFIPKSSTSTIL